MRARLLLLVSLASTAGCMSGSMFGPVDLVATISGPATLRVGTTAQYRATVTWNGKPSQAPPTGPDGGGVFWSSSDTAVATVTTLGVVTAVGLGRTEIKGVPFAFSGEGDRIPGTLIITVIE